MNIHQRRIYKHVVEMISDGALKPGDKLPTEMELGAKFKTGRLNAHYAVKSLEEAGLLTRNKRGGTTVKSIPSTFTLGQLKSETSDSVCVLNQYADTISSIHWNEKLIAPLERILKEHGLELKYRSICDIREPAVYKRLLEELVSNGCKAIVLIATGTGDGIAFEKPEMLSEFHERVFIFDPGQYVWQNLPYNTVSIDLFGEGVIAAERLLIHHGLKRIAIVKPEGFERHWFDLRRKGVACAMKRILGRDVNPITLESPRDVPSLGDFENLGVVASHDACAVKILDVAEAAGIEVGEKGMKLVSFDDDVKYRARGISTISPDYGRIGARLAEMIVSGIEKSNEINCVKIGANLIVRQTA